ncbi:DUF5011 domain-containing protein [Patescibacteria group bacterium]|nr:DUF5011 domain-containing protein [Patescibacteria group bacterium]
MKNHGFREFKVLSLIIFLLFPFFTSATTKCFSDGYTVLTLNGVFTNEEQAKENKRTLERKLLPTFEGQLVTVDFLHNPSHLAGLSDIAVAAYQGIFDNETVQDYDLTQILSDASQKITTQKVLIVAHSQGNFYANSFYDVVAGNSGGIPKESLGVYAVATPSGRTPGNGLWLTSTSDKIIAGLVGGTLSRKIMTPNVTIPLTQDDDENGHNFSSVYLKYQSVRIISDIDKSLELLKNNSIQSENKPCMNPPKITFVHKTVGVVYAVADPAANISNTALSTVYEVSNIALTSGAKALAVGIQTSYEGLSYFVKTIENTGKLAFHSGKNLASIESIDSDTEPEKDTNIIKVADAQEHAVNDQGKKSVIIKKQKDLPIKEESKEQVSEQSKKEEKNDVLIEEVKEKLVLEVEADSKLEESKINNGREYSPGFGGGNPTTVTPVVVPDTTAPTISITGSNPKYILINSAYTDSGATASDNIDGTVSVTSTSTVNTSILGNYSVTYSAKDVAGNTSTSSRAVNVVSNIYIPEKKFGLDSLNQDWQVWVFNGSNVYDWSDTYVNNFLREQYKIQALSGAFCSQCLQRGIFLRDPQTGFETTDLSKSSLESNPQNSMNNTIYNVVLQWDALGYTYTISHGTTTDSTGHTNISNVGENMWVGWDGSYNNFQTFPSGDWQGTVSSSPLSRTGGGSMITQPYSVKKVTTEPTTSSLTLPTTGELAETGISPRRGRENLTAFEFNITYKNPSNLTPQNVTLHVKNSLNLESTILMQKATNNGNTLSDDSFVNGETYLATSTYSSGDYTYYFTSKDSDGNTIRTPSTGSLRFTVIASTYTYSSKYTFGTDNGDGNDWQAWSFNGSYIYNWSDTYVSGYLLEQFKIRSFAGSSCSSCLQRGIFNHDPKKGFETSDRSVSVLEGNPQNSSTNTIYDVSIQWDSTGYTYTVSHGATTDSTGHTNIANVGSDLWVGWDASFNNFQTFPSGDSYGTVPGSTSLTGGSNMMIKPYAVFN